ncbi:hypothetical protein ACT7DH_08630 [Bacillus pacificus]
MCKFCVASIPTYNRRATGRNVLRRNIHILLLTIFMIKERDVEIIKIEGSVEIAPILGLVDAIVDIVETGKTLQENGLIVFEGNVFYICSNDCE